MAEYLVVFDAVRGASGRFSLFVDRFLCVRDDFVCDALNVVQLMVLFFELLVVFFELFKRNVYLLVLACVLGLGLVFWFWLARGHFSRFVLGFGSAGLQSWACVLQRMLALGFWAWALG